MTLKKRVLPKEVISQETSYTQCSFIVSCWLKYKWNMQTSRENIPSGTLTPALSGWPGLVKGPGEWSNKVRADHLGAMTSFPGSPPSPSWSQLQFCSIIHPHSPASPAAATSPHKKAWAPNPQENQIRYPQLKNLALPYLDLIYLSCPTLFPP